MGWPKCTLESWQNFNVSFNTIFLINYFKHKKTMDVCHSSPMISNRKYKGLATILFACDLKIRFFFPFFHFFFNFLFSFPVPSIPLVYLVFLAFLAREQFPTGFSSFLNVFVCFFLLQSQSVHDNLISDWFKSRDALPALSASSLPRIPTWSGIYQNLLDCQHRSHDVPDYVVNYTENTIRKHSYLSDDRLQFSADKDTEYFCYCRYSQTVPLD